jgi:lipid-binding SYLF domain-containing protein
MIRRISYGASLLLLIVAGVPLRAHDRELRTVEAAAATIEALCDISLKGIPPALMQEAKGVAIIPHVVKVGFLLGGRFGRGVVLVRQADGTWSNPVFITLAGGGIGWQAGIQSTDLVLVFRTSHSLDRVLRGKSKVTLGGDVAIAAGPLGRQAEAATDLQLQAEIFSYSRSRGLFAGISLEGAGLLVDAGANEAFYGLPGGAPDAVLGRRQALIPAVETLRALLARLSTPAAPPVIFIPPPPPPALPSVPPPRPR